MFPNRKADRQIAPWRQGILSHHKRKRSCKAQEQRIEPVVTVLSAAAGRMLKVREIQFLNSLDDRELAIFTELMRDVVGSFVLPFGYGYFND